MSATWVRDTDLDDIAATYNGLITQYSQTSVVDFNQDGRADLEIGPSYSRFVRTDTGYDPYTLPAFADPRQCV